MSSTIGRLSYLNSVFVHNLVDLLDFDSQGVYNKMIHFQHTIYTLNCRLGRFQAAYTVSSLLVHCKLLLGTIFSANRKKECEFAKYEINKIELSIAFLVLEYEPKTYRVGITR